LASCRLDGASVDVIVNLVPGESFESLETWWLEQERERPRAQVATILAMRVPSAVADTGSTPRDRIRCDDGASPARRSSSIDSRACRNAGRVVDSRGYGYAEVTAGGIPLDEIDPATMQSRVCPGLFLVGEILDVDGRWAASTFSGRGRLAGWPDTPSPDAVMNSPSSWLVQHAGLLPREGRALDVACGRGRHALWLAAHGLTTLAVDRDAEAIRELNEAAVARRLPLRAEVRDLEERIESVPRLDLRRDRRRALICIGRSFLR
jgi:hypothetical protein